MPIKDYLKFATYTHDQLLSLRTLGPEPSQCVRMIVDTIITTRQTIRGCRGRQQRRLVPVYTECGAMGVWIISGNRPVRLGQSSGQTRHTTFNVNIKRQPVTNLRLVSPSRSTAPSIYVINVNSLAKPHALEQLTADLLAYNVGIAITTETKLKQKHRSQAFGINGYEFFRFDRLGQGSPTSGPRAGSGPPRSPIRPAAPFPKI